MGAASAGMAASRHSDAHAAILPPISSLSRTCFCSMRLENLVHHACEHGYHPVVDDYRAVGDGVAHVFVVGESIERPASRQRPRIAELDERIDGGFRFVGVRQTVVIVDQPT